MKILVTGGAGYIGSVLVPMLLSKNNEVTVLDNFMYGQTSLLNCCHDPNLKIINGDARNEALISKLVSLADCIIPLACIFGAPACDKDPIAARTINLEAIKTLVGLRPFSINHRQKVIFLNTNNGYGLGQKDVYCTEESPLTPISLYGRLKVEAESYILEAGNSIVLRLATGFCVSPRMRLDLLVNDFVYRAVTDRFLTVYEPHAKRNFIHVRDVVRAFIHCIENFDEMNGKVYNLGLSNAK